MVWEIKPPWRVATVAEWEIGVGDRAADVLSRTGLRDSKHNTT